MFLFELYLVFSKEVKDSNGKAKYQYKMKMMTSDMTITEHIEGDECKFALINGRTPTGSQESKVRPNTSPMSSQTLTSVPQVILKANNLDTKHVWVKKIRHLISDTYFGTSKVGASLPSLSVPQNSNRSSKYTGTSHRSSRDLEDAGSLDESLENLDQGSLASFGSGGTTDSERVSTEHACDGDGDAQGHALSNLNKLVAQTLSLSKP